MSELYQALPRRTRPTNFRGPRGLVDQEIAATSLANAVARGRVAQAYLFAGPRGTGKTTAGRVLAMALNCPNRTPDGEPCATCDTCRRIHTGVGTMDVIEIDAASNRGVDDAKQLRESAMYAPTREGAYKVYIIDEAHMLTREAWNALLKILEEPPPRTTFVLATTEPEKIQQTAPAILSRCQRLNFRSISADNIAAHLKDVANQFGIAITDDAIRLIAQLARGGMRDALTLLDSVRNLHANENEPITADDIRRHAGVPSEALVIGAIDILVSGNSDENRGRIFDMNASLDRQGTDPVRFFDDVQEALITLQALRSGKPYVGPWTANTLQRLRGYAPRLPSEAIARCLVLAREMRPEVEGANPARGLFAFMQIAIGIVAETQSAANARAQ